MNFNKNSLIKAMDNVDNQIGCLYEFQQKRKGDLWIISALGQESVKNVFKKDLIIDNEKFKKALQLDNFDYEFLPAMHPDLNIKCKNFGKLKALIDISDNCFLVNLMERDFSYKDKGVSFCKFCD